LHDFDLLQLDELINDYEVTTVSGLIMTELSKKQGEKHLANFLSGIDWKVEDYSRMIAKSDKSCRCLYCCVFSAAA
jgi:hypothetical protein